MGFHGHEEEIEGVDRGVWVEEGIGRGTGSNEVF